MNSEDSCVQREDLEAIRELMQQQIEALEKLIETKITGLKEVIDKNEKQANDNHEHLQELITLAKAEGQAAREKIDTDIRTLREGRSTDKGRMLGQEPWMKLIFYVLAAILTAALLAFFAGRGSNTPPTPTTNGEHR